MDATEPKLGMVQVGPLELPLGETRLVAELQLPMPLLPAPLGEPAPS